MIVVDTNVICYRCMVSPHSQAADAAWAKDSDWIAPIIWRSEFRNVLAGEIRRRFLTLDAAIQIVALAETILAGNEFSLASSAILRLVSASNCSAYDCEFVALAEEQRVPLVTADRQVLRDFPRIAISLERFVRG